MKPIIASLLVIIVSSLVFLLSGVVDEAEPTPGAELLPSDWLGIVQRVQAHAIPPEILLGAEGECAELEGALAERGHQRADFRRRARLLYSRWVAEQLRSEQQEVNTAIAEAEILPEGQEPPAAVPLPEEDGLSAPCAEALERLHLRLMSRGEDS
jgi:hypothetical protein